MLRPQQAAKHPIDRVFLLEAVEPILRNPALAPVRARQLAADSAGRVGVVAQVHGQQNGFAEVGGLIEGPKGGFQAPYYVAAPDNLRWVTMANPLTYGVAALRHVLYAGQDTGIALPPLWLCLVVTAGFGVATFALAVWGARRGGRA